MASRRSRNQKKTLKAKYLKVKNIGIIEDGEIIFDKPLILLYGEIRQGKTTYLNAIRWVCGGSFPADIIRHGQKDAEIEFGFDGGMIRREFYVSKKAPFETKARDVQFIKNGRPVDKPVREIERLLNPFLLNQDYLRNMGETDRKKYFTEMFAVDTTELDTEAFNANRDAAALRSKLTGYGEIDLTEVKPVDAAELKKELAEIREKASKARTEIETSNAAIAKHNDTRARGIEKQDELALAIETAEKALAELKAKKSPVDSWLAANPAKELAKLPAAPDTSELETKIQNAGAQNVKAEQFQRNKKRAEEKEADEKQLSALEKRQREIKAEKVKKLSTISETCGVKDLAFDETGQFTFQGTQAGMLSTSQIMLLSSQLSALYPEGLGVELMDRAESLGKSIFSFVDRAKANELTILATIVGESPAEAPSEVGVFVVEAGKVTEALNP